MILYSYCLRDDVGSAPNPFWGICTLVICKPSIRRTASVGDWVVGLGSANSPIGDISCSIVYAMKVTKRLSMKEYDTFCREKLPEKIPDPKNPDFRRRVGDCIYDFSNFESSPKLRDSVHSEANRGTDLAGKNALLSEHFYYFGNKPVSLPAELHPIIHRTQGHKSRANSEYQDAFIKGLEGIGLRGMDYTGNHSTSRMLWRQWTAVVFVPIEIRKKTRVTKSAEEWAVNPEPHVQEAFLRRLRTSPKS